MYLEKVNSKIIDGINVDIKEDDDIYIYKNDNAEIVGISVISSGNENVFRFYILDKYQGNGYGKRLVDASLKMLKNNGYKEIYFVLHRSNIKAIKIISSLGGKHLSNIEDLCRYVIYL